MSKHPLQVILEAAERSVFSHQGWLAVSTVPDALGPLISDVLDEVRLAGDRDKDESIRISDAFRSMRILRNDPMVVYFPGVRFVDSETRS